MGVPDTNQFSLSDVITELNPATPDLWACFLAGEASYFDPAYKNNKNNLLEFRNYKPMAATNSFTFSTTTINSISLSYAVTGLQGALSNYTWTVTGGITASGTSNFINFSNNTGVAHVTITSTDTIFNITLEGQGLTALNVSTLHNLKNLYFGTNSLSTIDLSNNTLLNNLNTNNNPLFTLDVTNNTALEFLNCANNSLTTLNLSNNITLDGLDCSNNPFTQLDLSNNTDLIALACVNNNLSTLNLNNNTTLYSLNCSNNNLTTLNISNNTLLDNLNCLNNNLTPAALDDIIIKLDTFGFVSGILQIGPGRTSASNVSVANLTSKNWLIS